MQVGGGQTMSKVAAITSSTGWLQSQRQLWRGVYSVVMGAGPAHALHFATYEFCKVRFYQWIQQGSLTRDENLHLLLATSSAGACATLAHDVMMTPFDGKRKK